MEIDVIDERGTFARESISFSKQIEAAQISPSGDSLEIHKGREITLPRAMGRLLLKIFQYFD